MCVAELEKVPSKGNQNDHGVVVIPEKTKKTRTLQLGKEKGRGEGYGSGLQYHEGCGISEQGTVVVDKLPEY